MSVNNGSSVYNEGGLTDADVKNIVDNLPEFQAKAEKNSVVAISDAIVTHGPQLGGKWFKIASRSETSGNVNMVGIWDIFSSYDLFDYSVELIVNVRNGVSGTKPVLRLFSLYGDVWDSENIKIKLVVSGLVGDVNVELWVYTDFDYSAVGIAERQGNTWRTSKTKGKWSYFSYENSGGSSEPTADPDNNIFVYDVNVIKRQPAIFDNYPTKNSTSLVNSGKLYDVFTDDGGGEIVEAPPQQVYETGKFYFVAGKVCRCTAYSAASATFDVYGVVEALNYVLSQT